MSERVSVQRQLEEDGEANVDEEPIECCCSKCQLTWKSGLIVGTVLYIFFGGCLFWTTWKIIGINEKELQSTKFSFLLFINFSFGLVTTVGNGEFLPQQPAVQLLVTLYTIFGVPLFFTTIVKIALDAVISSGASANKRPLSAEQTTVADGQREGCYYGCLGRFFIVIALLVVVGIPFGVILYMVAIFLTSISAHVVPTVTGIILSLFAVRSVYSVQFNDGIIWLQFGLHLLTTATILLLAILIAKFANAHLLPNQPISAPSEVVFRNQQQHYDAPLLQETSVLVAPTTLNVY